MSTDTKWIIGTIVPTIVIVAGLLSVQIAGVNARIDDLNGRMERLEADARSMDARLRAVEVAFAKVDQHLETLERALLPGPTAGNWRADSLGTIVVAVAPGKVNTSSLPFGRRHT